MMKLKHVAFIFMGPEVDPKIHRAEIKTPQFNLTIIGVNVNNLNQTIDIAKELVANGVQIIELCSGYGSSWIGKLSEIFDHKIPIGNVLFGPEFRDSISELLK
jgi:hypothetical protein